MGFIPYSEPLTNALKMFFVWVYLLHCLIHFAVSLPLREYTAKILLGIVKLMMGPAVSPWGVGCSANYNSYYPLTHTLYWAKGSLGNR